MAVVNGFILFKAVFSVITILQIEIKSSATALLDSLLVTQMSASTRSTECHQRKLL
ncbi:hypothetical protein ABNX05_17745 [Lysinibacillus sp. M3]|uniref:Uncharacterized protein n=1 Tax=Lysinibacillus zambalensis TaxID=3160866 RepID=A0ABV1MVD1_9BACI